VKVPILKAAGGREILRGQGRGIHHGQQVGQRGLHGFVVKSFKTRGLLLWQAPVRKRGSKKDGGIAGRAAGSAEKDIDQVLQPYGWKRGSVEGLSEVSLAPAGQVAIEIVKKTQTKRTMQSHVRYLGNQDNRKRRVKDAGAWE